MNYNISIEIEKVPGAKVMEIKDRRCVVIPIDNDRGMCVDAYEKFDHHGAAEVGAPQPDSE